MKWSDFACLFRPVCLFRCGMWDYEGRRDTYMILLRKMVWPLGRPRRRREDNIKTDVKYNGLREWDLCGSVQRQDTHEHVKEPSDPIDCGSTEWSVWSWNPDGARHYYSSLLEKYVPSHPACCIVDTRGCLFPPSVKWAWCATGRFSGTLLPFRLWAYVACTGSLPFLR